MAILPFAHHPRPTRAALTAQVARLERLLLELVSRPTVPHSVREEILGVLAGTRAKTAVLNAPAEQRLVDAYRAMRPDRKQLATLLFTLLACPRSRRRLTAPTAVPPVQ
jgi:hypothetical protein